METDFFDISFDRLRALKREAREKTELYKAIRTQLQSVNIRVENLERFLTAEVHAAGDKSLERQLNDILKEKISIDTSSATREDSKANFLAMILYKANITGKGLTSKELFELAKDDDNDYSGSPGYTNNVIYKLKKRGMVEKREDRYFLTEDGLEYFSQLLADKK